MNNYLKLISRMAYSSAIETRYTYTKVNETWEPDTPVALIIIRIYNFVIFKIEKSR